MSVQLLMPSAAQTHSSDGKHSDSSPHQCRHHHVQATNKPAKHATPSSQSIIDLTQSEASHSNNLDTADHTPAKVTSSHTVNVTSSVQHVRSPTLSGRRRRLQSTSSEGTSPSIESLAEQLQSTVRITSSSSSNNTPQPRKHLFASKKSPPDMRHSPVIVSEPTSPLTAHQPTKRGKVITADGKSVAASSRRSSINTQTISSKQPRRFYIDANGYEVEEEEYNVGIDPTASQPSTDDPAAELDALMQRVHVNTEKADRTGHTPYII